MTAAVATTTGSGIERWLDAFREAAPALPGADSPWLAALRQRSMERFARTGWPTNRLENWRHTSLAFLDKTEFTPAALRESVDLSRSRAAVERLREELGRAGHWFAFVDGQAAPGLSHPGSLPAGVDIAPLSQFLASRQGGEPADSLQALFDDDDSGEAPAALNTAFAADGAVIRVDRGVVVDEPIHLVFVAASAGGAFHLRNLITAAEGAQLTVVEHYLGIGDDAQDDPTLTTTVTRIRAGAGACVTHVKLQQERPTAVHLGSLDMRQARASRCVSHSMSFGARFSRNDIAARLDDEGGEVLLNGLYHVDGRRHVDHHTSIRHEKPGCTSQEFYRGVLDDAGRGVFTGRIRVAPGAVRTDAVQRTDSLLLSPQAETDARPELEIYADDVKCAHGATVGQIDETSLFYLRSRGFDPEHARNMLIHAFAVQALDRIEIPAVRGRVSAALRACLPGAQSLENLS